MFHLERAICEWKASLRNCRAVQDGDLADLEAYLRDKIDAGRAEGLSEEAAFQEAAAQFSDAGRLDDDYRLAYKPRNLVLRFGSDARLALRLIRRHALVSILSIAGLAAGLGCFLVLLAYVTNEKSYDSYHENAGRIHRVVQQLSIPDHGGFLAITPAPLAAALKREFPEVRETARIFRARNILLAQGDRKIVQEEVHFVDPSLFDIFTFPLREGSAGSLEDPRTLLLSESAALRLFGDEPPLGKTVTLEGRDEFVVGGVMKDIPRNSHFVMEVAVPF